MAKQDPYHENLTKEFNEIFNQFQELTPQQQRFLRSRWLDQLIWMEKKAAQCRDSYYRLRLTAIVLGVITPVLIGLDVNNNGTTRQLLKYTTIGLSSVVAICTAVEEFFHYGEKWYQYRRACESLKAQGWQFFQLRGPYRSFTGYSEAFPVFVDHVEEIIAQDVELFKVQLNKRDEAEAASSQQPLTGSNEAPGIRPKETRDEWH